MSPAGVWKDKDCETDAEGVVKCWRCWQPRYVFDARFAMSFFVFLWNNAFMVALGQILIAMCVGLWFFQTSENQQKRSVVFGAVRTITRYHLGSVMFGSFIVAVVEFLRYVAKYYEKQAKAMKNQTAALILKCVQCVLWCFEKFIQFLNKNAYIQIALTGKDTRGGASGFGLPRLLGVVFGWRLAPFRRNPGPLSSRACGDHEFATAEVGSFLTSIGDRRSCPPSTSPLGNSQPRLEAWW